MLCLAGSAAADHTAVFQDPQGDAGVGAADLTYFRAISHLDGTLRLGAQIANKTGFSLHDIYRFGLDTDRTATTPGIGGFFGSEIYLELRWVISEQQHAAFAYVWDEALGDYVEVGPPIDLGYGAGPFAEIRIRDFGLAFGDRVDLVFQSYNDDSGGSDIAPNGTGRWTFQIRRCDLEGTGGADRLTSGARGDWICGFGGDDRLRGRGGDDLIYGGRGADRITGGPGVDVLEGGRGSDRVRAGSGSDYIYVKGGGADVVRCGPGFDSVEADRRDELIGCEDRF